MNRAKTFLFGLVAALVVTAGAASPALAQTTAKKPNILVIWGDDIGTWNISHNSRGMMGYQTPNIDRIASEGVAFTDYYGQQSCTAGRAAFISGSVPVRSGMTKVGLPGAKEGWQKTDVTMATVLKSQGYATGQFGKNHQGDRDEHLPTMHGFDEFLGNLYHLNAEEEPENEDYPRDRKLPNGKTFREKFGPRGVLHTWADGKGGQRIENTGPLTKKRMETIDEETLAAAKDFITRQAKAGQALLLLVERHPHALPHAREGRAPPSGQDEYTDGMIEHDMHVGELLKLIDDLGLANDTIVQYSTDNGPHYNTWPDAGTMPFRSEKNSNWEGAYRVPCFVRWPGHFPAGTTLNGIVAHEDWLPTFAAAAGAPDIKDKLLKGVELNGRTYKNHLDGYNLLDYLERQDEGVAAQGVLLRERRRPDRRHALRRLEGRSSWRTAVRPSASGASRSSSCACRCSSTCAAIPSSVPSTTRTPTTTGSSTACSCSRRCSRLAAKFLMTMKDYPPSQTAGSFNLTKMQKQIEAVHRRQVTRRFTRRARRRQAAGAVCDMRRPADRFVRQNTESCLA